MSIDFLTPAEKAESAFWTRVKECGFAADDALTPCAWTTGRMSGG